MRKFNITVNGNTYNVDVEEVGGTIASTPVAAAPVNAAPAPAPAAPVGDGEKIVAPMPGMVIDFKVADGAQVKKGDVVMILEAMKMENNINAPCDGTFKSVATKGSNVSTGDVLAVIS